MVEMKQPHTSCYPGKRVIVKLRDGTRIEDRFVRRTDRYIFLAVAGRIHKGDLKSFSIYKGARSDLTPDSPETDESSG